MRSLRVKKKNAYNNTEEKKSHWAITEFPVIIFLIKFYEDFISLFCFDDSIDECIPTRLD